MSKECIRPGQFRRVELVWKEDAFPLTQEQIADVAALYQDSLQDYRPGKILTGKS